MERRNSLLTFAQLAQTYPLFTGSRAFRVFLLLMRFISRLESNLKYPQYVTTIADLKKVSCGTRKQGEGEGDQDMATHPQLRHISRPHLHHFFYTLISSFQPHICSQQWRPRPTPAPYAQALAPTTRGKCHSMSYCSAACQQSD
jgi:hypothetical protein